jgi:hypothetical protein
MIKNTLEYYNTQQLILLIKKIISNNRLCQEKQFVDIVKDVNAIDVVEPVIVNVVNAQLVVTLIANMINVVNVLDVIKNIHIEEDKIEIYYFNNTVTNNNVLQKNSFKY